MRASMAVLAIWIGLSGTFTLANAQQPQMPTLQVCNLSKVQGSAVVKIVSRSDATHTGSFKIRIDLACDPRGGAGYPVGTVTIAGISMSDSIIQGDITNMTVEQITSTGKYSPTVYLNGRCKAANVPGCRFWLMIVDNKNPNQPETPDVVGFLVFDGIGKRVAHGTGPVLEGDIVVTPATN